MEVIGTAIAGRLDLGSRSSVQQPRRTPLVVLIKDGTTEYAPIRALCDFLDVSIVSVENELELVPILRERRPMAVLTGIEGIDQDGFHIMKTVAKHDATLPILVLTGDNPAMAGAADAIEEMWGLSSVVILPEMPGPAALVDFLFRAGRLGRCLGLLPA